MGNIKVNKATMYLFILLIMSFRSLISLLKYSFILVISCSLNLVISLSSKLMSLMFKYLFNKFIVFF